MDFEPPVHGGWANAKIKGKDGIPTHVILFDTPLKLSGAASGPIDSE